MNTPRNIKQLLLLHNYNLLAKTFSQKFKQLTVASVLLIAFIFPVRVWCQTLTAPTAFPSNITPTGFTLTWTASMNANLYTIDVSTSNAFTSGTYNTYSTSGTTYAVSGLASSTLYYYRLQALKITSPTEYSTYSALHTVTTAIAPPAPPIAISPDNTTIQTGAFIAQWNAAATATSYQLDVSAQSDFSSLVLNNINVTTTSYAVSGLSAGTLYYYRVRASNAGGSSASSNRVSTGTLTQTPTATGPTNVTANSFIANWSATSGAATYQLDISAKQDFATVLNTWNNLTGTSQTVTFNSNKAIIFYRVRAINGGGLPSANSTSILGINLTQNYIHTTNVLVSGFTPDENNSGSVSQRNVRYDFFDGLGRVTQTVNMQGSVSNKDVVQPVVYDNAGRVMTTYLPYTDANADGYYKVNALVGTSSSGTAQDQYRLGEQYKFYQLGGTLAKDDYPYATKIFENSPLNRTLEQGAPGAAFQPDPASTYFSPTATDHSVKFTYEVNDANEVIIWSYFPPDNLFPNGLVSPGVLSSPTYYAPSQLYKNRTKDEALNEVIEYVDKEGRKILRKVQSSPTQWAQTYYIYNDKNQLVMVLQPEAVKAIMGN